MRFIPNSVAYYAARFVAAFGSSTRSRKNNLLATPENLRNAVTLAAKHADCVQLKLDEKFGTPELRKVIKAAFDQSSITGPLSFYNVEWVLPFIDSWLSARTTSAEEKKSESKETKASTAPAEPERLSEDQIRKFVARIDKLCGPALKASIAERDKQMLKRLSDTDFKIRERYVRRDGNCMFDALTDQLGVVSVRKTPKSLEWDQPLDDHSLYEESAHTRATIAQAILEGDMQHVQKFMLEKEIADLTKDGGWGSHVVLLVAATVYKRNIFVYGSRQAGGEPPLTIEPCTEAGKREAAKHTSLYLCHWFELHYGSLTTCC